MANIGVLISAITGLVLVFFRLPSAIAQWSPYFDSLLSSISPTILNWIQNLLIAVFSFIAGWYLKSLRTPSFSQSNGEAESAYSAEQGHTNLSSDTNQSDASTDTIKGCLEVGGALWRGTAYVSNGHLDDVEVPYKVLCPNCQTVMYDNEKESVPFATTATTYWDCPSCGYQTEESISKYHDAEKLFDTHFEKIVESDDEEYSLENLIESSPQEIWRDYSEIVNDSQVSTECFH